MCFPLNFVKLLRTYFFIMTLMIIECIISPRFDYSFFLNPSNILLGKGNRKYSKTTKTETRFKQGS